MAKTAKLSEKAKEILEVLKTNEKPLTLAEVKELVEGANSAHLTALRNRGYVNSTPVEKEVVTVTKRVVNEYAVPKEETETETAE